MSVWTVGSLVAIAMLAVTVLALLRDRPVPRAEPPHPPWLLPTPHELRTVELPTAWFGYDPGPVDAWRAAVVVAYEELHRAAGPDARAAAERRIAQRLGREDELPAAAEEPPPADPAPDEVR